MLELEEDSEGARIATCRILFQTHVSKSARASAGSRAATNL